MSDIKDVASHLRARSGLVRAAAGVVFAALASVPGAAQAPDPSGSATFVVLVRGARVGSETMTLSRTGSGWVISSTGRLDAPFNLVTTKFEAKYAPDWQPQQLSIEGVLAGQPFTLETSFGLTTATTDLTQSAQRSSNARQVSPRTIVLPSNFYAAYEALAARLDNAAPGTRLPAFLAPENEGVITVDGVTTRHIVIPDGAIDVQDWSLTFSQPGGPVPIDVWTDARHRLAKVELPAASLVALRDDLASVMAREERVTHTGDESVFIPANGFALGATVTKPTRPAPGPVVVFAAGPSVQGRDDVLYGLPIFGQLAVRLADAGYVVVRYDPRGTGQSGGRPEGASLAEYASDVRSIVAWLRKRKDVDADRIAVAGYADSAPVALLAAAKESRIKAVVLLAASADNGRTAVMTQQEQLLARLKISDAERNSRIGMQNRINEATLSGKGWEGIPPAVRRQADTPWFRSWLLFDPAPVIRQLKQPLFIVQGGLDAEVAPANAERLRAAARERKLPETAVQSVVVPGVNHLLTPATTGSVEEYSSLATRSVATEVSAVVTAWLDRTLPAR